MATSNPARVLRALARELGKVYKTEKLKDVQAYTYLHEQIQQFEVTGEQICREQNEMQHVAETYLCYLESARKQEELSELYKGKGERSIEDSANIVGLTLPKIYSETTDKPEK